MRRQARGRSPARGISAGNSLHPHAGFQQWEWARRSWAGAESQPVVLDLRLPIRDDHLNADGTILVGLVVQGDEEVPMSLIEDRIHRKVDSETTARDALTMDEQILLQPLEEVEQVRLPCGGVGDQSAQGRSIQTVIRALQQLIHPYGVDEFLEFLPGFGFSDLSAGEQVLQVQETFHHLTGGCTDVGERGQCLLPSLPLQRKVGIEMRTNHRAEDRLEFGWVVRGCVEGEIGEWVINLA